MTSKSTPQKGIFQFEDYKSLLRSKVAENSTTWGVIRKLSEAAGCQRSYLSQVLSGSVHLTKDQAFGLASYWELSQLETRYFLGLVEHARCGSAKYRKHMEEELRVLKQENDNLARKVDHARPVSIEAEALYYSSWHWAAIHIIASIPSFQTTRAISARLQLPPELVSNCLETLSRFGMIKKVKDRWIFAGNSVHLSKGSPILPTLHQNWRNRAMNDIHMGSADSVHYSSLHSLSLKAYQDIKTLLQDAIERSHKIAGPSDCEELACVNIDLFRV